MLAAIERSPDGRVHAEFDQLAAPTGRMSCLHPPLLSMPKETAVRRCIVPAPGFIFVNADYAAIELRVAAQITCDVPLREVFARGGDPHVKTAAQLLRKTEHEVTQAERQRAKAVGFGFLFGMGAATFVSHALATYGVAFTLVEAAEFKRMFLTTYPGIAKWQREARQDYRRSQSVSTASGRRRVLVAEEDFTHRLNTPVQGTAADGIKNAIVILRPRLAGLGARIVLAIHDELLVETPIAVAGEAKRLVEAAMIEGMREFVPDVPIAVVARIQRSWAEADEIDLDRPACA